MRSSHLLQSGASGPKKMCWFRSLLFLNIGCFLNRAFVTVRNSEANCLLKINWRELWLELDQVNPEGPSQECSFMDKGSLCDPRDIVKPNVSEDIPFVLKVLSETAALFEMKNVPFHNVRDFLEYNYVIQDELKIALRSHFSHQLTTITVNECFKKMKIFLNRDTHCAWQVIHQDALVIFQQLEFYIVTSQLN